MQGLKMSARVSAAMLALGAVLALGACGQRETLLSVYASATERATPDLAIVTLGVVARGATANAAQQAQAQRMTAVMAAVRAAGVAETDVQTVNYALEPQYTYARGAPARISGYLSRNTVAIRVSNLQAVSALIDATVADGANELQSIQYTFADTEAAHDAARATAVETARRRAAAYAEAAGMRVGRIVAITEPGAAPPPYPVPVDGRYGGVLAEQSASANAPLMPGQNDTRSSVTVIFALK